MTDSKFDQDEAVAVLRRTPATLDALLRGLPSAWTDADEGGASWSPRLILAHLVHGEEEDWVPRTKRILAHGPSVPFDPFAPEACRDRADGRRCDELLDRFAEARAENVRFIQQSRFGPEDLRRRGTHPAFGEVSLTELLATWVVHDLSHVRQVARVLARHWKHEVGPWRAYLPVLEE